MDRKTLISFILVVFVVAGGILYYESNRIMQQSTTHSYRYSITLDSTGPVNNCTLILPACSMNGSSQIADAIESGQMTGVPDGWDLVLLTTRDTVSLKISAPCIIGSSSITPVAAEEEIPAKRPRNTHTPVFMKASICSDSVIDTKSPSGEEPLLAPRMNVTQVSCNFPHPEDMPLSCHSYTIPVYASYMSDSEVVLSIRVELVGENAWWLGGWTGNSYSDRLYLELNGPVSGWVEADGFSVYGMGRY